MSCPGCPAPGSSALRHSPAEEGRHREDQQPLRCEQEAFRRRLIGMETFAGGTLLKMRSSKTYRTYCGVRNPSTASRMFLPKKPRSDPARGQPLTADGLDEILDGARGRAGLSHATCHELCHTCFRRLREAGMVLEAIQAQPHPMDDATAARPPGPAAHRPGSDRFAPQGCVTLVACSARCTSIGLWRGRRPI